MTTRDDIKAAVTKSLFDVAPDLEGLVLDEKASLQGTYDLDSADFLRFLTRIQEHLDVVIPPSAARLLTTIEGAVQYLEGQGG